MAQRGTRVRHVAAATGETEPERWQRNFSELLQELRVALTGVQILFAFLLILAFTDGFDASQGFTRAVYLVALLSAAVATILLIAPVGYHRMLFRRSMKPQLVRYTHRVALAALALVVLSMASAVSLAVDVVLHRPAAVLLSIALGLVFVVLAVLVPLRKRREGGDLWRGRRTTGARTGAPGPARAGGAGHARVGRQRRADRQRSGRPDR